MSLLAKNNLERKIKNGVLNANEPVTCSILRTGAVCNLSVNGGTTVLTNGMSKFIGDDFSTELNSHGVIGDITFNIKDLNYGVSRYITYKLRYAAIEEWIDLLTVYVDAIPENYSGRIKLAKKEVLNLTISDITATNLKYSSERDDYFGMIVTTEDGSEFIIKPEREFVGTVVATNIDEYDTCSLVVTIAHEDTTKLALTRRLTITMKNSVRKHGNDLIGSKIQLRATSYVPGERLESFWKLTALFVLYEKGTV